MRISDWSSDVCSSDLTPLDIGDGDLLVRAERDGGEDVRIGDGVRITLTLKEDLAVVDGAGRIGQQHEIEIDGLAAAILTGHLGLSGRLTLGDGRRGHAEAQRKHRSEERRVGKEWVSQFRSRGTPYH